MKAPNKSVGSRNPEGTLTDHYPLSIQTSPTENSIAHALVLNTFLPQLFRLSTPDKRPGKKVRSRISSKRLFAFGTSDKRFATDRICEYLVDCMDTRSDFCSDFIFAFAFDDECHIFAILLRGAKKRDQMRRLTPPRRFFQQAKPF